MQRYTGILKFCYQGLLIVNKVFINYNYFIIEEVFFLRVKCDLLIRDNKVRCNGLRIVTPMIS